jgi:hypothetical protein
MKPNSNDSPPETVILTEVPPEAREVGNQPMRCEWCGHHYALPLYEMPDGPVVSVARCHACGATSNQMPVEVAA